MGGEALHRRSHAGDQSAAADGRSHRRRIGQVGHDLQTDGPLARSHIGVGIGVDVHHALHPGQLLRPGLPLGGQGAHQLHFAAEGLDSGQLHRVGVGGHDDDGANAQPLGGAGHTLGVVARGGAHQAVGALLGGEGEGLVHGAANFERAHDLKPLELQIDLAAQGGI